MQFGVLGSLQVVAGDPGKPEVISAGRLRALLAALLWRANQPVPVDELAELVWDGAPPDRAPEAIRALVMRLRRRLGQQAAARIMTRAPGYAIEASGDELDASRFGTLAQEAGAAVRTGRWAEAARTAAQALGLWRGTPLMDIPSQLLRDRWVPHLEQLHVQVLEWRIEADLHQSRHGQLIPELRELTARHPLREPFHGQLMLALARSGRQAEALVVFDEVRRLLASELGIDPGSELRQLHKRILAGDTSLMTPPAAAEAGPVTAGQDGQGNGQRSGDDREGAVPRQLPAPVRPFVGREAELAELNGLLDRAGPPAAVMISAIGGTAGVGKTALGVHWAHRVAARFPDGQLYVNLRGFDPVRDPVPTAAAVRAVLDGLGVPAERIPAGLDAQVGLYRSLVAGRKMLLMLDNARNAEQIRPLLPGSPGCLVVVTSRSDLAGLAALEGAHPLRLSLLTDAEARVLLMARLGAARMNAEPGAAAQLIRLCARLPLALVITAARVADGPELPLGVFAGELADTRSRLDALDTGDALASVRAVFSWSAGSLSAPAARMFRLLGVHPGPDITVPAAASLAGVSLPQARAVLRELAAASLIAEDARGRFGLHDLLRAYAAEQAQGSGDESGNHEAAMRILDHYLHTAYAAAYLINPDRDAITLPRPRPGVVPEQLASHQQAVSWLEAEHEVLRSAVSLAGETGSDSHGWQLPWAMANFLDWHGYWDEWASTQRYALAAANRLDDTAAQAVTLRLLGQACARLGDHGQAGAHLTEASGLYRQLGDQDGEARVHQTLSWLAGLQGSYHSALGHTEQALSLYQASGNRTGEATALNNAGYARILLGDWQQGRANCQRALALQEELGSLNGQANTWHSIGLAEHHLGDLPEAARCYRRAIDILHELGRRHLAAGTLTHLGDTLDAAGDLEGARDAWQQALDILDDMRNSDAAKVRAKLERLGEPGAHLRAQRV